MPPGRWHVGILDQLRMLPRMIAMNGRTFPRAARVLRLMEKKHPTDREHYYLAVLGVEPGLQGRGFGAALIEPVLSRCDRDGTPAYLESSKERNIAFYERHGFRVLEELRCPDRAVDLADVARPVALARARLTRTPALSHVRRGRGTRPSRI